MSKRSARPTPELSLRIAPGRIVWGDYDTLAWLSDRLQYRGAVVDALAGVADALTGMLDADALPACLHQATADRITQLQGIVRELDEP